MSNIIMDEKLTDLKKVIFKLSEIGCILSAENEKQSAMLAEKDKHISDLAEQVNQLNDDNNETMQSNTDLQRANAEFERANQYLVDENDKFEEENKNLRDTIRRLQDENNDLKKEKRKLEEKIGQKKSSLQKELETANATIANLRKQVSDKEQINIYMGSLLEKIGCVQTAVENLKDNGNNGSDSKNNSSDISDEDKHYISTVPKHFKAEVEKELLESKPKQPDENNLPDNTSETSENPHALDSDGEDSKNSVCDGNNADALDAGINAMNGENKNPEENNDGDSEPQTCWGGMK